MNGYSRGYSATGKCIVLDTTALLAAVQNVMPPPLYTTSIVAGEVKDRENREKLEASLETGRIEILDPPEEAFKHAEKTARRLGVNRKLSPADISVAALAHHLEQELGCSVTVFTDDYTLQYLLHEMSIEFRALRTKGIKTNQ